MVIWLEDLTTDPDRDRQEALDREAERLAAQLLADEEHPVTDDDRVIDVTDPAHVVDVTDEPDEVERDDVRDDVEHDPDLRVGEDVRYVLSEVHAARISRH